MVIDDSRVMRSIVMQALRQSQFASFEFSEAADGLEAIEKFDPENIDIIFVDWNMPGMNGIEFASAIRSKNSSNQIPIVMISSETGSAKNQSAFEQARINCFVKKPFTIEMIREKVGPIVAEILDNRGNDANRLIRHSEIKVS